MALINSFKKIAFKAALAWDNVELVQQKIQEENYPIDIQMITSAIGSGSVKSLTYLLENSSLELTEEDAQQLFKKLSGLDGKEHGEVAKLLHEKLNIFKDIPLPELFEQFVDSKTSLSLIGKVLTDLKFSKEAVTEQFVEQIKNVDGSLTNCLLNNDLLDVNYRVSIPRLDGKMELNVSLAGLAADAQNHSVLAAWENNKLPKSVNDIIPINDYKDYIQRKMADVKDAGSEYFNPMSKVSESSLDVLDPSPLAHALEDNGDKKQALKSLHSNLRQIAQNFEKTFSQTDKDYLQSIQAQESKIIEDHSLFRQIRNFITGNEQIDNSPVVIPSKETSMNKISSMQAKQQPALETNGMKPGSMQ